VRAYFEVWIGSWRAYVVFITPIWCTYPAARGDTFDFQSMFGSLPNIPLDQIPAFIKMKISENELRKAEAEAEARNVEANKDAETRKAEMEARKAEAETRKDDAKAPAKHAFGVVINHDALGLKTQLAEEMQRLGFKGKIARVIREGKSGEYDTDLTFEGSIKGECGGSEKVCEATWL